MKLDTRNLELLRINAYTSSQAVAVLRTLGLVRDGEDTEALKRAVSLKVLYRPGQSLPPRCDKRSRQDFFCVRDRNHYGPCIPYLRNNGQQAKAASFAGRYPYRFTLRFLRWLENTRPAPETVEVALRLGALKGDVGKTERDFHDIEAVDLDDEESDDENVP